jgi:hypothetical protein
MVISKAFLTSGSSINSDKVDELAPTTTTNSTNVMPPASYIKDPLANRIRLNRAGLAVDPLKSSIPDIKEVIKGDTSST